VRLYTHWARSVGAVLHIFVPALTGSEAALGEDSTKYAGSDSGAFAFVEMADYAGATAAVEAIVGRSFGKHVVHAAIALEDGQDAGIAGVVVDARLSSRVPAKEQ